MSQCPVCNLEMTDPVNMTCLLTTVVSTPDRQVYNRIPYDPEDTDPAHRCHDCNVKGGSYHHLGCDIEVCPICKGQLIACPHTFERLPKIDINAIKEREYIEMAKRSGAEMDNSGFLRVLNTNLFIDTVAPEGYQHFNLDHHERRTYFCIPGMGVEVSPLCVLAKVEKKAQELAELNQCRIYYRNVCLEPDRSFTFHFRGWAQPRPMAPAEIAPTLPPEAPALYVVAEMKKSGKGIMRLIGATTSKPVAQRLCKALAKRQPYSVFKLVPVPEYAAEQAYQVSFNLGTREWLVIEAKSNQYYERAMPEMSDPVPTVVEDLLLWVPVYATNEAEARKYAQSYLFDYIKVDEEGAGD